MKYKVPFYKPSFLNSIKNINSENFESITKDSITKLEQKFLDNSNCSRALSVSNSSSAIHLAMCAIDLKRGDKVICAINSYVDVPEAIRHFDSEPIFTDIEPNTYHMNIESLKKVVKENKSKKLRAIVVSHFAGLMDEMDEIMEIAKENKLIVIEDFSDAPLLMDNIKVKGDLAIFSLNYKLDNSIKGAMITFKHINHFSRAKLLREHGIVYKSKEVDYLYDVIDIGCDYRLDSINAYLLLGLLEDRAKLIEKKQEIAKFYLQELEGVEHIKLPISSPNHPYSYFIIEIDKNRDAFARELKNKGIEVGLHYIPINFLKYYKEKYNLKVFSFPNALSMYQKVLSLPCNGKMSRTEAQIVVDAIKEVAKNHI
jgi:dTDP-4-amino-4,6-dideoxygalactose transaminase